MRVIGIDIGGTSVKFGLFDDKTLLDKLELPTTKDLTEVIKKGINTLSPLSELSGIGVTVPAPTKDNYMFHAANLPWSNMNVKEHLSKELGFDNIEVLNDANAAALGEYHFGGVFDSAVMVTLGTGVGGGIIVDGKVLEGHGGFGGEIGHIQLDDKYNFECGCTATGCAETVASATGLKNLYKNYSQKELEAKEIFDLAKTGDEVAVKVTHLYAAYIAKFCQFLSVIVNPEIFIIGGGVSKAGEYLLDLIKEEFVRINAFKSLDNQEFKLAELGNDAGMYGAYYLIKNK